MGLFSRKKAPKKHVDPVEENVINHESSASKIVYGMVSSDDNETARLVDQLKKGHPLCLNFEDIEIPLANKVLAFLIGATYALGGKTIEIKPKIYLFVLLTQLEDGSINNWLLQFKE